MTFSVENNFKGMEKLFNQDTFLEKNNKKFKEIEEKVSYLSYILNNALTMCA